MNLYQILSFLVFIIGVFGVINQKDMILKLLNLGTIQSGVVLLFIAISYNGHSPIITPGIESYSDPLIHSFLLTVIVIGFANLSLMLVFVMILSSKIKTYQIDEIEKKIK